MTGLQNNTFHIVSLGCAKNSVDSDSMAQLLIKAGYRLAKTPGQARVIIVNTCGFIGPARDESFNILAETASKKKRGQLLIAAGCLPQRYGTGVTQDIFGIDGMLGTRRWMDIVQVVENLLDTSKPYYHFPESPTVGEDEHGALRVSVQNGSAYLKIADGCRHKCAFCAIPLIKGTAVSRPADLILREARYLEHKGVHEIVLIAQDTTDYGHDFGKTNSLVHLLKKLVAVAPGIDWVRIMYTYPGEVTDELIQVIAENSQIVHYLDIPLQHAHPSTLKRMRRPANVDGVRKTIEKIRKVIPDIALRTTFIVGYPGETEKEFRALLDFMEEIRFDKVGAFKFSFEKGTASEKLGDPVPGEVKEERYRRLMELQQGISLERNRAFIGKRLGVLFEGSGQGVSIGRSYRDAPEIDGLVLVEGKIPSGSLLPVNVTAATEYDLSGELAIKR